MLILDIHVYSVFGIVHGTGVTKLWRRLCLQIRNTNLVDKQIPNVCPHSKNKTDGTFIHMLKWNVRLTWDMHMISTSPLSRHDMVDVLFNISFGLRDGWWGLEGAIVHQHIPALQNKCYILPKTPLESTIKQTSLPKIVRTARHVRQKYFDWNI